ncbi:MAG: hypothetical protein SGPRY_010923, partial [Prymnesium sp.]
MALPSSLLLALLSSARVSAHGSGAWRDPRHSNAAVPAAGMRYIAEVSHRLTMVGSDDGTEWWTIRGWCSGEGMTDIHFDFSSK